MRKLSINLIGLLFIIGSTTICNSQIYKWVDEKGTVHFTQDPSTIPEKYRDKVKSREMEEFPDEPKKAEPFRPVLKQKSEGWKLETPAKQKEEEPAPPAPSPGYIPFEKFKYITKGMTEAEVLSRFGPPTRIEEDQVKSKGTTSGGTVTGIVSPGGSISGTVSGGSFKGETFVVKRYYYIGDRSKGEQTRIIIFEKGKVVDYKTISP